MINSKPKGTFKTNTLKLLFGNFGAQALNLLTIPLITRLYGPESYGILTLFLSVSVIVVEISCLRLQTVILLPEKTEDAYNVFFLCILFVSLFTLLIISISLLVNNTSFQLPESYQSLASYLYLMALYVFLAGSYKALGFLAVRQNQFTIQAVSRVSNAGMNKIFSLGYGFLLLDNPVGLLGGLIVGHITCCWLMIKYSLKEFLNFSSSIQIKTLINIFKRYKSFAIYSGTALLESFSIAMAPIILGILYGPAVLGFVGLSQRFIQHPLGALGDAVSRSFFQKITQAHRNGQNYSNDVLNLFNALFLVSFLPINLFSTVSPEIFSFFFGQEWTTAGVYFSFLSLSFLSGFLYRPFSIIFDIQEKQRLRFTINCLRSVANIAAIYTTAYLFGRPIYAIIAYSITNTVTTFSIIFSLMNMTGISYISLFTNIAKQLLTGLILALTLLFIKHYLNLNIMLLFFITAVCIISHYIYIFSKEPKLKMQLLFLVKKFKN